MRNVVATTSGLLVSFLLTACGGGDTSDTPGTGTGGTTAHPAGGSGGTAGKGVGASGGTGGGAMTGGTGGGVSAGGSGGASPTGGSGAGAGRANATGGAGMGMGMGGAMTGGSGGQPGSGGALPMAGASNPGGGAGSGGSAGAGPTTTCTITPTATASTAIPTVQTVTFTTDATGITKAEIEFGAAGSTMTAPVDLTDPTYKTYLVGMKPSTAYTYRIKITSPAGTCVSADQMFTTGALANAPKPTVTIMDMAKHDKGFIVMSSGIGGTAAYIIDPDGTVVWVAPSSVVPGQPSRAHLSWDAKRFIVMSLNVQNSSAGKIQSVAMDGTDMKSISGTTASHHDFTAIPGGIATLLWNKSGIDAPCSLVEFPDSGMQKTIVADFSTIYNSSSFHTNAIHYYERDDSYTIGDRNPNLYAKLTRAGALVWQFGGMNPKDAAKNFSGVTTWSVNHGHHLTADNQFAFFNNGSGSSSTAFIYKLDPTTMKATQTAKITGTNSMVLGDAQILPNGNVLVSGSTTGTMAEVEPMSGAIIMTIKAPSGQQFGYSEFRESLYGAPPY
nr:hypothetical protein Hi04_10k_c3120_00008 [uncultured bacterium]